MALGRQQGSWWPQLPKCYRLPSGVTEKLALMSQSTHGSTDRGRSAELTGQDPGTSCAALGNPLTALSLSFSCWETGGYTPDRPTSRGGTIRGLPGKHFAFIQMLHTFEGPLTEVAWDPSPEAALTCSRLGRVGVGCVPPPVSLTPARSPCSARARPCSRKGKGFAGVTLAGLPALARPRAGVHTEATSHMSHI